ncbi:THO complex subunit 4D-like [Mangifera indica]|uniref:THO complex subunit 4D-like n=1 Tax=Mangifera indica TaxID=29780 RepID=UPI001CFBA2C3|nr:THO complex subunit 4D-like [Mangifera indica]
MATSMDMSLDDIIKSRKKNGRVRGQGRAPRGRSGAGSSFNSGRMPGPVRRGPLTAKAQPTSYTIAKSFRRAKSFPWQHDLFEDSLRAAGISGVEVGAKLCVSNLHIGVTNEDIRVLFSEIGELKRYAIHYDKNGRPSGSAEVVYTRRSDAFAALKRYNNVLLDGKLMKIEIVGPNAEVPISARVNVSGANGRRKRTVVMTPGSGHPVGSAIINRGSGQSRRGYVRNNRGRGRGNGQGKKKPVDKSAAELDKELDKYHAEAMQS